MAYSDVLNKTEAAVKAVIDALAVSGLTTYTKQDDDTQTLPKAIVKCGEFRELHDQGLYGNFQGAVAVRIVSNADDTTLAAHRARVATILDALSYDNLATTATAALADFTMIAADEMAVDHGVEERSFFTEWARNVTVCASDV